MAGLTDCERRGTLRRRPQGTVETVSNAGAHLIGATTHAAWAAHWPNAAGPFARPMNEIPKIVFSNSLTSADNSLTSADWDETTIAAGDLTETVTRLKRERPGGYPLAHVGARFARVGGLIRGYLGARLRPCLPE